MDFREAVIEAREKETHNSNSPGRRVLTWENFFRLFQNRDLSLGVSPENTLAITLTPVLGAQKKFD